MHLTLLAGQDCLGAESLPQIRVPQSGSPHVQNLYIKKALWHVTRPSKE
jgi:hypothetical protein